MRSTTLILGAVALFAALLAGTVARAADSVGLRVGEHDGFVRVVFDWPRAVGYRLERQDGVAALVFDEPLTVDLDPARRALADLVPSITVASDQRRVVFTLAEGVGVSAFDAGERVAIDFTPGQVQRVAEPAIPVRVRANEENGRLRLVFDWPAEVAYRVERDGPSVRVRFDRAARFDLSAIATDRVTLARNFAPDDDGKGLVMSVAADAQVVDSLVEARVVVDVAGGPAGAAPAEPETTVARAPLPAPKPARSPVAAAEPRPPSMAEPTPPATEPVLARRLRPVPGWAVRPVRDLAELGGTWPMLARVIPEHDGAVRLRLIVNRDHAMAVMLRDSTLWLALDAPFDVAIAAPPDPDLPCRDLGRIPTVEGTVLRCAVPEGYAAEVSRAGTIWEVLLAIDAKPPALPLEVSTSETLAVRVGVRDAAVAVTVADGAGGMLTLVPVRAPGAAVVEERTTFGYRILSTAQGVAVTDLAEGVRLDVTPDAVTIALHDAVGSLAAGDLLDLRGLAGQEAALAERVNLLTATGGASGDLADARLAHARALFAQDLAAEAWGQVKLVAAEAPQQAARPDVRALAGALLTRLGRAVEAGTFLDDPLLGGEWVDLWRGALAVERGDYGVVVERYRDVTAPWNELEPELRAWLGLEIARGLALGGEPSIAQAVLAIGVGQRPTGEIRDRAVLVAAVIHDAMRDRGAAVKLWSSVAGSSDRSVSAEARFSLAVAGLEAGALTPAEAIEAFERLSFAWRGGDREWQRVRRLVDLYLVNRQYRDAMIALRTLLIHIPEAPDTRQTTRRLADLFKDVMIGSASQFVSPLASLSIFNEFQELTPVGAEGDELVETLAERLADVDLVDQAGDLLEQQLANRLEGEAKIRVGVRVAELRLDAGDPEAALEALAAGGDGAAPKDVMERRRLAQARALAALGRTDEAVATLGVDRSTDAVWLLADMHWRARAWAASCNEIEALLARAGLGDGPWGTRADLAFRLALGYASAGDLAAAEGAGRRFEPLFVDDARRDMFALLTSGDSARPGDWNQLPAAIADVEDLEAFLAAYRASLPGMAAVEPETESGAGG